MHRRILNKMQLSRLFWDCYTRDQEKMANSWPALPQEKDPRNKGGTQFGSISSCISLVVSKVENSLSYHESPVA